MSHWSRLENWIWDRLRAGETADLDLYPDAAGPRDFNPQNPNVDLDGWRQVNPTFFRALLLNKDILLHRGDAAIFCAWFREPIDLAGRELRPFWLGRCRLDGELNLENSTCCRASLERSYISASIRMTRARIPQALSLNQATVVEAVEASGLRVGDLFLQRAEIRGDLNLATSNVNGSLYLDYATVHCVRGRGIRVSGQDTLEGILSRDGVQLSGGEFANDILLDGAKIGGAFDARGINVNGQLAAIDTAFCRNVDLLYAKCGHLVFHGSGCAEKIDARLIGVRSNVDLRGATLVSIALEGAEVGGELLISGGSVPPLEWSEGGELDLQNARAMMITITRDGWPDRLRLAGCVYERFVEPESVAGRAKLRSQWLIEWLGRDPVYSPQPYYQCAKVLTDMGHPDVAADVLYAGRERDRREARRNGDNPRASGLELSKWLIGYGYGRRLILRPLLAAAVLVGLGIVMMSCLPSLTPIPPTYRDVCSDLSDIQRICLDQQSPFWRFFFSLDMLLPIVELSREHTTVQAGLDGLAYGWFALQRLFGWVLALFIVAGLTGLSR